MSRNNRLRQGIQPFVALLLVLGITTSFAQAPVFVFENPPREDPLSQSWISAIHQSRDGFIWLGTTNGLIRFDGYQYKTYGHNPEDTASLSNNWVTEILEGPDGNLWIATDGGGVNEFLRAEERFRRYRRQPNHDASLSHDRVLTGAYGSGGTLWFGTQQGGLNRLDLRTRRFTSYPHKEGEEQSLSSDQVWAVWEDSLAREVWIGTGGGLDRLDLATGRFNHYRHDPADPQSLSFNFVMAIHQDTKGRVWVGTRNGLNLFDPVRKGFIRFFHRPEEPNSLISSFIYDIREDRQGRLWIAADGGTSLWNETTGNFFNYPADPQKEKSPRSGVIWQIYEDREDRLWFATYGGGYSVIHPYQRKIDSYALPLPAGSDARQNIIYGMIQDAGGYLWIGSYAGLHRFDPKTKDFRYLYPPWISAGQWWIFSMTQASRDRLIMLSDYGAIGLDLTSETFIPDYLGKGAPKAILHGVVMDRDSALWLFSNETGELFRKDGRSDEWRVFSPPDHLPQTVATSLFVDRQNQLWIGTNGAGLLRKKSGEDRFQQYVFDENDPASLSSDHVQSILEDQAGNLWIGVRGGGLNLLLSDEGTGKFRHWARHNSGLANDRVLGLLEDRLGRLWLGTDNGLYRFNPRENKFQYYGVRDGLFSSDLWQGAGLKTREGTLVMSSWNGINLIEPDSIRENPHLPKVVLTDFLLFSRPVPVRGAYADTLGYPSPLVKSLSQTEEIRLRWWQNDIAFEFAALNFTLPDKNQYLYRLEGYQQEWIEADAGRRRAAYTNLDPGAYVFHVLASNNDGLWNSEGAQIRIVIIPPWWAMWWAYVLYVLALSGFIYLYLYLVFKRRLAQAEASHLQKIDVAKTRLYTNISHEFRTPITVISGMAKQIREMPEKWFREGLEMIVQNANQLLNLVNQMLELRKLEAGVLPVHYQQGEIFSFLRQMIEPFIWQAGHKGIQLHFLPGQNELVMDFDPDKIIRICSNLLSNALKFTPEGGHIYLQVDRVERRNADWLLIKVRDTGVGIAPDQLPRIFDRFFQAEHSSPNAGPFPRQGGTGIGLALLSELVSLLKGEVGVVSELGRGTEFSVHLPLSCQAPVRPLPEERDIVRTVEEMAPPSHKAREDRPEENENELPIALLVDDHPDVITYLRACLSGHYWIETAGDGAEGIARATEIIPDIVVSDIMMPGVDGLALCRHLKQDERTDHIPIVLLTARADQASRLSGLEVGADSYLSKPFDPEELLLCLKNLLINREQVRRHYFAASPGADGRKEQAGAPSRDDLFVRKVSALIEERIDQFDLKVQDLCDELYLSHSQLHRKLTAVCGLSPNRLIRQIRLERARTLLLDPERSITSIAFDAGFQNPDYFTRVFHQEFGMTPSEFRERQ